MHFQRWASAVANIGVLILFHEILTQQQSKAQEILQVVQRISGSVTPTHSTKSQISKPSTIPDNVSPTRKDANVTTSLTNKPNKKCKCECPYANARDARALQQCAASVRSYSSASNNVGNADPPLEVNGIFPSLAVKASSGPTRTECGIGALMPWADKLYMVSYLSVPEGGNGTGLYAIDENFVVRTT